MDKPKLHSGRMEVACAELIGWRSHIIIPNVSWGLFLKHEADLIVLDSKGRLTEIEIKINAGDLKADFKKKHKHYSPIISRLIYAVPDNLFELANEIVPRDNGIIAVRYNEVGSKYEAYWVRQCRHTKHTRKPDDATISNLLRLGCMRIWSLKTIIYDKQNK